MSRYIAVIDTETNWNNEVMSIGIAVGYADTYKPVKLKYYILNPECKVGGMYSDVLKMEKIKYIECTRKEAIPDIKNFLLKYGITSIFAYNASFDHGHLPELQSFTWFDIMKIAPYRQYNTKIPDDVECCRTGRIKGKYGVEAIIRMMSGNVSYCEKHNAIYDALDELNIMELLNLDIDIYKNALI